MNIDWKEDAIKDLLKLEKHIQNRVYKKVEFLSKGHSVDIKRLISSNLYRLRVGDYRGIFEINGQTINILGIGHRKNIY